MLQSYSALPFNITSGRDDGSGHGRPADRQRRFIPRNAGMGSDFFT